MIFLSIIGLIRFFLSNYCGVCGISSPISPIGITFLYIVAVLVINKTLCFSEINFNIFSIKNFRLFLENYFINLIIITKFIFLFLLKCIFLYFCYVCSLYGIFPEIPSYFSDIFVVLVAC